MLQAPRPDQGWSLELAGGTQPAGHPGHLVPFTGRPLPVITSKGTRPGSSWADLLFAFVVRKITDRRDALLAEAEPKAQAPRIPADCDKTLLPCDPHKGFRSLTDLVWADDIATMRVADTASNLLVGVKNHHRSQLRLLLGARLPAFLWPAKKQLSWRSPQELEQKPCAEKSSASGGGHGQVSVLREHVAPTKVPLIPTYRHLGAQISLHGKMKQEVGYRVAQAKAAFQESRRKGLSLPRDWHLQEGLHFPGHCAAEATIWGRLLASFE